MIISSIVGSMGRLGNQLFQIAVLINVALVNKYEYGILIKNKIPKYWINDPNGKFQYNLCADECFTLSNMKYVNDTSFINQRHEALQFHYYPEILKISDNTDIIGYFQSEKFFKENKDFILKEFTFKEEIQHIAKEYIQRHKQDGKLLIGVHVRRGDYTIIQKYHPMLTYQNYYREAFNKFKNLDCKFIFFSDDIPMCRETFPKNNNVIFPDSQNIYIDMCMMSMCDHNIIANSSYSWWASYLNKNKSKIIIAPKIWFGDAHSNLNTKDIIPENWIKI